MRQITVEIPDMQSTHCQSLVRSAVSHINGVLVDYVSPCELELTLNEEMEKEIVLSVSKLGYTVAGVHKTEF